MDFSAEKTATFDEKGRVVLPAVYKNEMGGKIQGGQLAIEMDPYEKCINIYPLPVWETRIAAIKSKLNRNNKKQSRLLDMFYRSFMIITVPESCRMNIPNNFLEKAGIVKEVIFVGQGDRIRLWDAAHYDAYIESLGDYGELFEEILGNEGE